MQEITAKNKYYYYTTLPEKAAVVTATITLKSEIRPDYLKIACEKALDRNEFFRQKPILTSEGDVVREENHADVPVMPEDERVANLGTADTNGYLFRITYKERTLRMNSSHAVTDGHGATMFLHTLLYHYFSLQGKEIEPDSNILLPEVIDATERGNLYEDIPAEFEPKCPFVQTFQCFITPEKRVLLETDRTRSFRLRMATPDMLRYVKSLNCTPGPAMMAIIAEAMCELYEVGDRNILTGLPVDMRPILNSRALSNYGVVTVIPFEKDDFSLSLEKKTQKLNDTLKLSLQRENIMSVAAFFAMASRKAPDVRLNDREAVFRMQQKQMTDKGAFTYLLSNVGRIMLPKGMEDLIDDYHEGTASVSYAPGIYIYSIGKNSYLELECDFESKDLFYAITDHIKRAGMEPEVVYDDYIRIDTVKPYLFDAV